MKKSLLEIYGLAVCFFAAATLMLIGGQAAWDVVKLLAPQVTLNASAWSRHQTDESFADWLKERHSSRDDQREIPTGADLTRARERSFAQDLTEHRRDAVRSLLENIVILVVAVIAFLIHWRIAARARQMNVEADRQPKSGTL